GSRVDTPHRVGGWTRAKTRALLVVAMRRDPSRRAREPSAREPFRCDRDWWTRFPPNGDPCRRHTRPPDHKPSDQGKRRTRTRHPKQKDDLAASRTVRPREVPSR